MDQLHCQKVLNEEARETTQKFDSAFQNEISIFCNSINSLWAKINQESSRPTEQEAYVRGIFVMGSNYLLASCHLFRLGFFAQSLGLLRPAWESFFVGLLCSSAKLDVFERYKSDTYKVSDARKDLKDNIVKFHLETEAMEKIESFYTKILHKNIHPTRLALSADYPINGKGVSYGGHFDDQKNSEYKNAIVMIGNTARYGEQLLHAALDCLSANRKLESIQKVLSTK